MTFPDTARAPRALVALGSPDHDNPGKGLAMADEHLTRRPLARSVRRTDAARLDVRRAFRFPEDRDAAWQQAAVDERVEFSEYIRECIDIGHSMKQAQRLTRRTSA
ncbi:MAG: hypothetical protein FJ253_12200 [Phycisphaerae bacterium]|nr:hypothetical protein [Phycisphaerae bacterium]